MVTFHACLASLMSNTSENVVPGWLLSLLFCCFYSQPSLSKHPVTFVNSLWKSDNGKDHQVFSMQSLACDDSHSPLH